MLGRKTGFTLIETLVAIAIIGVLAAIIIIAINPARQLSQARNTTRRANVREVSKALTTYQIDNRGSLPADIDGVLTMLGSATSGCVAVCGELDAQLIDQTHKISSTSGDFGTGLGNGDSFGYALAPLGDLNNDQVPDLAVGVVSDDDGGSARGAIYILFMNSTGTVAMKQKISSTIGGFGAGLDNSDNFGSAIANIGDLDGDGISDLAVGAYLDDDGGTNRGAVYILFLNQDGTVKAKQKISSTEGGFGVGLDNSDYFGRALTGLGDIDGDGVADLAAGVYLDDDGGTNRGAVYILFLNQDGTVKAKQKISSTSGNFGLGLGNSDYLGVAVADLGDMDGDGVADLATGAYQDDDGGANRGAVYILFLNQDGTVKAKQKISSTEGGFGAGLANSDGFGISLDSPVLAQAGRRYLLVGAHLSDDGGVNRGAAWLLVLNQDGTVTSKSKISQLTGGFSGALDDSDYFGFAVAALGYLDEDLATDYAVGAYLDDDGGSSRGAVYILQANRLTPNACINLTAELDPYLNGLPFDPSVGSAPSTFYAVGKLESGRVEIMACAAELGEKIYLME